MWKWTFPKEIFKIIYNYLDSEDKEIFTRTWNNKNKVYSIDNEHLIYHSIKNKYRKRILYLQPYINLNYKITYKILKLGDLKLIKLFLKKNKDIFPPHSCDTSALSGNLAVVRFLYFQGFKITPRILKNSFKSGNYEIAEYFMKYFINTESKIDYDSLFPAAAESGNVNLIKMLMKLTGKKDYDLMPEAAKSGNLEMFHFMLPNCVNRNNSKIFYNGVKSGNLELVKEIKKNNFRDSRSPMNKSIRKRYFSIIEYLIDIGYKVGYIPDSVIKSQDIEMIRFLLNHKVDFYLYEVRYSAIKNLEKSYDFFMSIKPLEGNYIEKAIEKGYLNIIKIYYKHVKTFHRRSFLTAIKENKIDILMFMNKKTGDFGGIKQITRRGMDSLIFDYIVSNANVKVTKYNITFKKN